MWDAWLTVLTSLLGGAVLAGTYGSVQRDFDGVRFVISTPIGSLSDHAVEAPRFAKAQKAANEYFDTHRELLEGMVRHYRRGAHPYASRRSWVAAEPPENVDQRVEIELSLAGAGPQAPHLRPPIAYFGLTRTLKPAQAERLAADFLLSQLSADGAFQHLAADPDENAPSAADLQTTLGGIIYFAASSPTQALSRLLPVARINEKLLRELAAAKNPMPVGPDSDGVAGHWVAQVLVAVLDQKPRPLKSLVQLGSLAPEAHTGAVKVFVLLLADDQLAAGIAAARASSHDPELSRWLAEMLSPDPR